MRIVSKTTNSLDEKSSLKGKEKTNTKKP